MGQRDIFVFAVDGVLADSGADVTKDILSDFLYAIGTTTRFYIATEGTLEDVVARLPKEIMELAEGVFTEKNTVLHRKTMRETDGVTPRWYVHERDEKGIYFNFDTVFVNRNHARLKDIVPKHEPEQIDKSDDFVYNKIVTVESPVDMIDKFYKIRFRG
jgi:phosphoglycolate phosphatase-like HAD superfamily hydrolase